MTNEDLVLLYQKGDKKALEQLIENNRGIVNKIVNKFNIDKTNSIDREDLEQEGYMGLIAAAERYNFNNDKKANFITYAVYWIHQKISRFVKYRSTNGESSLNVPVGEEGESELGDFIEGMDYGFENVEEKVYIQNLRKELEEVMITYNNLREREVLKLRYGWNSKEMTLNEIGAIFGITSNRVRNIEGMALRKLRNSRWAIKNIKEFAELGYIDNFYLEIFRERGIDV
jgi:RNA polymerase sigma factor (sigma-70 family)